MNDVVIILCDLCLEPIYRCACLPLDLDATEAPEVVWVASRPLTQSSKITHGWKFRYKRAVEEVYRLNKRNAGKVQHFLLPVD
jgi:hypothetical protein